MPKYRVQIYPIVSVLVSDVEADSQEDACKKAEQLADLYQFDHVHFAPPVDRITYMEDIDSFLVDEEGDESYERSTWYNASYERI